MEQLSLLSVFVAAAQEGANAHLPSNLEAAIPFYRGLLERYDAAMLAGDAIEVDRIEVEARLLVRHLNKQTPIILVDEDGPRNTLRRETAAAPGETTLWGQAGEFVVDVEEAKVRIETRGMFGIGGAVGFCVHAVDWSRPFLSNTGYFSFLGIPFAPEPGMTFEAFAREVIRTHIAMDLKGKLCLIDRRYGAPETLDAA